MAQPEDTISVQQYLYQQQMTIPSARGDFTQLLLATVEACKLIGREVRQFGVSKYQSETGETNIQDEKVHELDELANNLLVNRLFVSGQVCALASEENEGIISVPPNYRLGEYCVIFDPLDGYSNIGVGINIGTIFSVRRRITQGPAGSLEDFLMPGRRNQVCAGYVMYGASMLLVLTTGKGQGVNIFTYKPELGIFMLSHCNIRIPEMGEKSSYSVNQGNTQLWDDKTRAVFDHFMNQKMSSRHIDSLVADFHRTILTGGIFAYPANAKNPHGKLRLLCEEVPLAMIAEEAGGSASNGSVPTLDIQPISLHQRYPLYIGNTDAVKKAEEILKG